MFEFGKDSIEQAFYDDARGNTNFENCAGFFNELFKISDVIVPSKNIRCSIECELAGILYAFENIYK